MAKQVLDSLPVIDTRVCHEATQYSHCVGNVSTCHHCQVHQSSHCIDVGDSLHVLDVLRSGRGHAGIQMNTRIKMRGDRAGVSKTEALEDVQAVLALREVQGAIGTITNDLHTKLEGGRAEVSKLEVLSKLSFDMLDLGLGLGGQGDFIDEDRDNHIGALMVPNKDRGI
jgi:hypothetical protein